MSDFNLSFSYSELVRYEKYLKQFEPFMDKVDYKYKSKCIRDKCHKMLNSVRSNEYKSIKFIDEVDISLRNWLYDTFGLCEVLEAYRINNAYYHRTTRLKQRISKIVTKRSYFLTITWTDYYLSSTSPGYLKEGTRREYITRFLKKISTDYVANIDFGEKNNREHYHAVVQAENINFLDWQYGNLDFKLITYTDNDCVELARYVSKLTNHAIKETTKRQALIYPKKKI